MFIYFHSCLKCCPSLLDITVIPFLPRHFKTSSLFTATCKNAPSTRCVSAAKPLCKDVDIFRKPTTSLKQILH